MDIKLTKLASCAGCGAKVGAGTLSLLLDGLPVIRDEKLIVGFDKSDDASVYVVSDELALVQTLDFFPPIVDDPFLFGQIAATNALSDVYAMGGEPKLALNIMTVTETMTRESIHDILRGGYEKAYEAGAIISGGHTINDTEPKYGLSVTGFVHPKKVLTNSGAQPGDVLILTKPLGIGIITTAAKADMVSPALMAKITAQMAELNKKSRDNMVKYEVHSCTDVTGFSLLGHACEMAGGSGVTIHITSGSLKYHREALEFASMGMIPAGAYRNRDFAESRTKADPAIDLALMDIMFDPQTSGGLLISVKESDAQALLGDLLHHTNAAIVGYVTEAGEKEVVVE